jgi:CubicO group peptidase (beta-lactamase class C family)
MPPTTEALEADLDALAAETGFSGAVRAEDRTGVIVEKAYGLAHRGYEIPNTVDTRFAIASGTKSLTALVVMSLVEDGRLELGTTARSVLGDDLPLIADDVTVEHLLAHRSGIGDYLDEEADLDFSEYLLPVPVHQLADTESYLTVLDGFETKFAAGTAFAYCNGGYVVLALVAERVAGTPFHELVRERVCEPAGMVDTEFLRSDALPGRAALGYLEVGGETRSNVFHLPVRGTGDGGIYTTLADVSALWRALFDGRIVSREHVAEMTKPHSTTEDGGYGLGFWLVPESDDVDMVGGDAGVSFRSRHNPVTGLTMSVVSNTTDGAWPLGRRLREHLVPDAVPAPTVD